MDGSGRPAQRAGRNAGDDGRDGAGYPSGDADARECAVSLGRGATDTPDLHRLRLAVLGRQTRCGDCPGRRRTVIVVDDGTGPRGICAGCHVRREEAARRRDRLASEGALLRI